VASVNTQFSFLLFLFFFSRVVLGLQKFQLGDASRGRTQFFIFCFQALRIRMDMGVAFMDLSCVELGGQLGCIQQAIGMGRKYEIDLI